MVIKSILRDERIDAFNALVEITIGEYLSFARDIIDKNEFQRKKVIRSKIKEILREDLLKNCLIPSIVLAISDDNKYTIKDENDIETATKLVNAAVGERKILIIDGLQRTFVMMGLEEELIDINKFHSHKIRAEIYIGLNRIGLLYRMITLNTGQTTMSTRHLMEILYLDYTRVGIDGIQIVKDKDEDVIEPNTMSFNFKVILDGLNSYIEKNEAVIERVEILDNIRSLDTLKIDQGGKDIFREFLYTHKELLDVLVDKSDNWTYNADAAKDTVFKLNSNPFGKTILDIFKKSQAITGLGAALGFIRERKEINLIQIREQFPSIYADSNDWNSALLELLKTLDLIKEKSKKIGNDQRYFFKFFFRGLLTPDSDCYMNFNKACAYAYDYLRTEKEYKKDHRDVKN